MADGFSEKEANIDISNILNITQFLNVAAQKLSDNKYAPLINTVLTTNSADIPSVGLTYDNSSIRSLAFSGNLILGLVEPRHDSIIVVSWGTAMLIDIYNSIPDSDVIRKIFKVKHPKYTKYIENKKFDIQPERYAGSDFRMAVQELESKTSLLYFKIPPTKSK